MARTFFIETFGCQMNIADTERMSSLLSESGLEQASELSDADVILINGCSVRDKAVHKAVSTLGTYQTLKRPDGSRPIVGLGGCVGQLDKGKSFKRAPHLDFVFGPDVIDELPEIIGRVHGGERKLVYTDFDKSEKYSTETRLMAQKAQAFVNIMKGCDKYCTYCIVPYTRGREKSRTIQEVVDDIAQLVERGVKEVTLLGQNVNSFGKGNEGPTGEPETFPKLLRAIDGDPRNENLRRIRFTSSHPLDFSDELVECYDRDRGVRRLCAQLHLPVQSGSNRILQKMARHHAIESYEAQMTKLKALRPGIGLSTDLIVGFPTETEADFQETLGLLHRMKYDQVFVFAYSPRPGTRAAKLPDDVPQGEKLRRLNEVLRVQKEISAAKNKTRLGEVVEALVDGVATEDGVTTWTGRTECGRLIHFQWPSPRNLLGQLVSLRISNTTALALYGQSIEGNA